MIPGQGRNEVKPYTKEFKGAIRGRGPEGVGVESIPVTVAVSIRKAS